jgi:hypothetical protein
MRESDWRAWLDGLPTTRSGLHEVEAELNWQVVAMEAQLTAAVWQRQRGDERAKRIELNELNSKLMLIHSQLKILDLPPPPKVIDSAL